MKPAQKRAVVQFFRAGFRVSERRACRVADVPRSTCRYRSVAADQPALRIRLRDLAAARVRYGCRRHSVDRHSNKSALMPPALGELAKLAQQSRMTQLETPLVESRRPAMRSLRRRLSRQEVEELVARYTVGEAIRALSREYRISRSGLRQLLQSEGVTMPEQGITPEDAENAVRLYETGLTIRQVVEQVGYSFGTIQRVLH